MSSITFANTPVDGALVKPDDINSNQYDPGNPGTSFAEINGLINRGNFDTATWKLRSCMIRNRALGNGRTVGSTMLMDHFSPVNPPDKNQEGAFTPIPGAAMRVYLPRSPTVAWVTWQCVSGSDMGWKVNSTGGGTETIFRLFSQGTGSKVHSRQQPVACYWSGRMRFTDRMYSGSVMFCNETRLDSGWYSFYLGVWCSHYAERNATTTGATPMAEADMTNGGMTRIRTRNMKFLWLW